METVPVYIPAGGQNSRFGTDKARAVCGGASLLARVAAAAALVERNRVRAGMVERAEMHRWSSAVTHCGSCGDPLLTPLEDLPSFGSEWRAWLREPEQDDALRMLRTHTRTGRPLGSQSFIALVENLLNRVVRPRKGGRPRKQVKPG